jgi:uncharacterized protein (DUF305 family)
MNHNIQMAIYMIMSGLLSSMYIWSDKVSDVRISLNDVYMISLMTGWMLLFMNMSNNMIMSIISVIIISLSFIAIRKQYAINKHQFFRGMIPHHSMAIHMSRQLLSKKDDLNDTEKKLINSIIETQEKEIEIMKQLE